MASWPDSLRGKAKLVQLPFQPQPLFQLCSAAIVIVPAMPWDHSNVRTWEFTKAGPRMSPLAYRSGCYKRAIAVLQEENGDDCSRASVAASLHKAIHQSHAKHVVDPKPSSTGQVESASASQLLPASDNSKQKQEKLHAKAIKEQLRRQRQEERHEHNKRLWQQRYEQKLSTRQQELAVQVKQRREQQMETMQQLERQKQALEQQVQQNKQASAAIIQAAQDGGKDLTAGPQTQLSKIQNTKAAAEEQLATVSCGACHYAVLLTVCFH